MICPKCGFEQPESLDCARCGIVFSRFKGTAPAARPETPPPFAPPPLPPLPARSVPPPPPPMTAAPPSPFAPTNSFYEARFESAEVGGSLYEGPPVPAGPPQPSTMYGGPTNTGLPGRRATRPVDFTVGAILGQTFSIYLRNLIPFVVISALVVLPIFFGVYYMAVHFALYVSTKLPPQAGLNLQGLANGITVVGGAILSAPFASAALTYGVFQEMRKKEATILDCLRVGLSSVFSVLGVVIVQIIVIAIAAVACLVGGFVLMMVLPKVVGAIAFLGLIVGTLVYLTVIFSVSVPAAVEERPGVFEALRRSAALTEGHRGGVLGVLFVIGLLNQAAGYILEQGVGNTLSREYLTGVAVSQLLLTGLSATAAAVMYYKLRGASESVDVEDIASVFD